MLQGQPGLYNFVSGATAVVTTAETVIATTKAISSPFAGCTFVVEFRGVFQHGTGTTSIRLIIRRLSLTGTSVYDSGLLNATAGQIVQITAACTDQQAGEVASAPYVLTVTQTAASANGSATNMFSGIAVSS